jgi:uncharacterized protein (TIRG00374 family)
MKKILQILIPFLVAVLLFWLVYRNMDFNQLLDVFKRGLHYEWIAVAVGLNLVSNFLRGLRWHQLLEPVCPESKKRTAIIAIFLNYAINLVLPRVGEVARAGIMKKEDGVSFTRAVGTVITERLFDAFCLIIIAIVTILLQLGLFSDYFHQQAPSMGGLVRVIASPYVWGGLLLVIVVIGLFRKRFRHRAFYRKGQELLLKVWEGVQSIRTLRHPGLFLFYSVLLWAIYVLMFYVGRFFFPDEIQLGLLPMLGAFIMGSIGVSVPVQAGIGTYHAMVIYALTFYGLASNHSVCYLWLDCLA